ncbi:MAG: TonB-dependent receptor [Acidobacteriota bacterium]
MKQNRFKQTITSLLTLLTLLISTPVALVAQTANTGVVTGVVKDQSGAVVSNATVKAINKGTNAERLVTTSDTGAFELTQLTPGEYRIEIEAGGFAKYVQEPVTVNVLSRVTIEPALKPAGSAEQVTVTGESSPVVETTKTDVGGVVTQKQLESLPVNGRSFASLAVLIPGATQAPSFDPTKARTGTFSIGGSTGRNVNITIDGGDNKDNVVGGILQNYSMEGIQEFALSTQRFSAANGRSGGALLSVINKSGSNDLHGSLFGFFRDDTFNASAPKILAKANPIIFSDPNDVVKPAFSRQQFGGSLGGPAIKDKLFWFGTVEHTRERATSIVPTDTVSQIQLLAPLGYNVDRFFPQPFDDTQYTLKGDWHPQDNHAFSLRYAQQNNEALNDQAGFLIVQTDLSGGDRQLNDLHSLLGSWTWTANSRTVNQFLYQWSTFNNRILATSDLPNLAFADGIVVGRNANVPQQTTQRKHQFRDDLSWNVGNHALKFGGDYVFIPEIGGFFNFVSTPNYLFGDTIRNILTDTATYPQGLNTPGSVIQIVLAGGDPSTAFLDNSHQFSGYAQDDWRVSRRLTLNLGVRYDVDLGFVDAKRQERNRAVRALQIIGSPYGQRIAQNDTNNFSPRLGFAYDVFGDGRSVVRGGYGLYYDQSFQNVVTFAVQQAHDEIYGQLVNDDDGLSLSSPVPTIPRPFTNPLIPIRGRLIDPNFESPYSQQTNIGFAQEIGRNMALEFDYIHILGLHEFTGLDINPRIGPLIGADRNSPTPPRLLADAFAAHAAELTQEFGIPNPFSRITVAQSDGRSRYDAFTVSLRKRYSNRFQLNTHYTLSKAVTWFGLSGDFGQAPQNPFNKFDAAADFGPTSSDERHRFVVSGIFDLPWGIQLSPILQFASARPYSIFPEGADDINKDGIFNDTETRDGNDQNHLPPNSERGDIFSQVNLRVAKNFNFRNDRFKVGLFFEAFNLFNTANFGAAYQQVVGTPDFKRPINFYGATGFSEPLGIPFQAQFGFRFSF